MTDVSPKPRRGQSLPDWRLETLERRMDKVEDNISDIKDKMIEVKTLMESNANDQKKIKERITWAVWILAVIGGAYNLIAPEIVQSLAPPVVG